MFKHKPLTLAAGQPEPEIADTTENKTIISEEVENTAVVEKVNYFAVENYGGSTAKVNEGINEVIKNIQTESKSKNDNVKVVENVVSI